MSWSPPDPAMKAFGHPIPYMIVLNTLFLMMAICFVFAHCSDPGRVPNEWPWDPTQKRVGKGILAANALGIERKLDGRHRFCRICGKYKPDRAHHCRLCGSCILEMDHHCPWINNCVGFKNHKYFFLLLFYGVLSLVGFLVFMAPKFFLACTRVVQFLDIVVIFAWIFAIPASMLITFFFCFHVWLTYKAYTTIEFCEKRNAPDSKKYEDNEVKVKVVYARSLFDRGFCANLTHVLGINPLIWFIPTRCGMPADGTRFRTRDDLGDPFARPPPKQRRRRGNTGEPKRMGR
eukprot:g1986.t1